MPVRRLSLRIFLVLALAAVPAAHAQIANGDFENGVAPWVASDNFTVTIVGTGGNPGGYGRILETQGASGAGTLSQTFECGVGPGDGDCEVSFDYRIAVLSGSSVGFQFTVAVDDPDNTIFNSDVADGLWKQGLVSFPCGTRTIHFRLISLAQDNRQVEVCVDNVSAECVQPTAVQASTWGGIKRLFP